MTVSELIKLLQAMPQDLQVAYSIYGEQTLLEADEIEIAELCEPREDGWIKHKRPDKPTQKYLLLPGK